MMKSVAGYLALSFFLLPLSSSLPSTRRQRDTSTVADPHQKMTGFLHSAVIRKPTLSKLSSNDSLISSSSTRRTTALRPKTSQPLSILHLERSTVCTPMKYRVDLHDEGCNAVIDTTMCAGTCLSFTFPKHLHATRSANRASRLNKTCSCCLAVKFGESIQRVVSCRTKEGLTKLKYIVVPKVTECACRLCR
eukprot:m.311552 g.311552  ORF g.311552 m.311552 type:complete len:192 (+) comp79136_c0_seq1:125-700(+)